MRKNKSKSIISIFTLLGVCAFFYACSVFQSDRDQLQVKMIDAYQSSAKLFSYVWNPKLFMEKSSEPHVKKLLKNLSRDFHNIDNVKGISEDPGFEIALDAQNRLLNDIIDRFEDGNKEYAWWKLKGVTHNCVACHSRFSSNTDFIGINVQPADTSFEARLAAAEFLIASRQFSKADQELIMLAENLSQFDSSVSFSMEVLRLWLLVHVRVHETYHGAAVELSKIKDSGKFIEEQKNVLSSWIIDLQTLQAEKRFNFKNSIDEVVSLLGDLESERTFDQDDRSFVKTARASALLHTFALGDVDKDEKPMLLLLLGASYQRMTIPSLKSLAPLYFEECIRSYPKSAAAKTAFQLFSWEFSFSHTGSGGEQLDDDDSILINELKDLLK